MSLRHLDSSVALMIIGHRRYLLRPFRLTICILCSLVEVAMMSIVQFVNKIEKEEM